MDQFASVVQGGEDLKFAELRGAFPLVFDDEAEIANRVIDLLQFDFSTVLEHPDPMRYRGGGKANAPSPVSPNDIY